MVRHDKNTPNQIGGAVLRVRAMKLGRMRKGAVLAGLLIATASGTGYLMTDSGGIGAARAAMASALADPLSLFTDRSPGGREPGALTQTKGARERMLAQEREHPKGAPKPETPVERVLTSLRERPMVIDEPGLPFGTAPGPSVSIPQVLGPQVASFPGSIIPGVPPLTNGSSGGGGSSSGGGSSGGTTGAIPEPATWAMLLLGFFSIGAVLRRRGRPAPVATNR